ncbi:DNA repair protein RAD50 [Folsomia candida]|uniref:DNA repair protein RAD50 n=1 Tax=Folsomia candida TaxID=158441 RepID=A0A226EZ91_FOLCA|nr:DNA repair protein RAD50 [Folsomia candida]
MEVKLKSLKFYGFRTFSDDSEVHEINFDKKLTIIHGRNGSGKTTVVEILLFCMTGKLSSNPDGLDSFVTGVPATITLTFIKGSDTYEIKWTLNRPNVKIMATCQIKENRTEAEEIIRKILDVPAGAVEKLILVPQENTLWAFNTPTNLKEVLDKLLNLEEDNKQLMKLVEAKKEIEKRMKTAEIDLTVAQGAAEKHPSIVTEEAATSRKEAELQAVVTQLTDEIEEMLNKHEKYDKVLKLGEDLDRLKSCADSLNISEEEIDTLDEKELEYDLARVDAELGDKLSTIMRKIREKDDLAIQLQDTSEQLGHAKANLENSEVSLAQILEYCSQYDSPDVESCKGVIQAKITKLQEDLEQINIRKEKVEVQNRLDSCIKLEQMALNFEKFKKMSDQKWTTLLQLERDIAKVEGKIEAGQENVDDFERLCPDETILMAELNGRILLLKRNLKYLTAQLATKTATFDEMETQFFDELKFDPNLASVVQSQNNGSRDYPLPAKIARIDESLLSNDSKSQNKFSQIATEKSTLLQKLGGLNSRLIVDETTEDIKPQLDDELFKLKMAFGQIENLQRLSVARNNGEGTHLMVDAFNASCEILREQAAQKEIELKELEIVIHDVKKKKEKIQFKREKAIPCISQIREIKTALATATQTLISCSLESTQVSTHAGQLFDQITQKTTTLENAKEKSATASGELNEIRKALATSTANVAACKIHEEAMSNLVTGYKIADTVASAKRHQILTKHQEMVAEINQYLADKWESLFPYDDIPSISLSQVEIKHEGVRRVDYNYHFNMDTSADGELKMRGRSSHGEKILAALIIRCALAKKFGPNCEILAFDEPMGGLDGDMGRGLVDHFSSITDKTQVIVTTHSLEFAKALVSKGNAVGEEVGFYRVEKEGGRSKFHEGFGDLLDD